MKVTQEKLPASQVGLEIEITPEMSQQAYEKTLQEFTRYANIPGFRKGKVPRQVLIQRFGSTRIKASVVEDLIQSSLKKALEQEKIAAIGSPELRTSFEELIEKFAPGAALTFSAAVDVAPEVKLNQYSGLSVQAEEFTYDPARVDQVLEDYRKRSATLVPVENRPAQPGDLATVDFQGRLTGELPEGGSDEIPGGSAEDFEIELAEGRFIEGFVDGIIGMTIGETKEVAVTFPESYPQADLAAQPAVFTITLKELKERELPELDDEFAQEVSEFETLSELRESLESRFQKEVDQKTQNSKQEALLKQLVSELEVELPETMIRREVDHAVTQTAMQFSQQGMDIRKTFTQEVVAMLRDQARPEALNRLQRTLVLGEVAKQESIEVEPDAVQAKMQEIMADYEGQDIDVDRLREVVQEDLLREQILAWLEANNTIELVPEGSLQAAEPAPEEPEPETAAISTTAAQPADEVIAPDEPIEVMAEVVADPPEDAEDAPVEVVEATKPAKAEKTAKSTKSTKKKPSK
ncbi:MAG: trigger factor [Elainella sp. Prado103]|jgi:trigger factor|nr:trigger factor [Elainella sp. Prado103]